MEIFFQFETYVALLTLTIIEIILGIDNIIFISIITNKVEYKTEGLSEEEINQIIIKYTH